MRLKDQALTFSIAVEPMPAFPNWKLESLGWSPGTPVWLLQADGSQRGESWKNYRFEIVATQALAAAGDHINVHMAELNEDWTLVPLGARVMHAGLVACVEIDWNKDRRLALPIGWAKVERAAPRPLGPTVADVEALKPDEIKTLWAGYKFLLAALKRGGGAPPGERVWPLEVFRPVFVQVWRKLHADLKRSPTDVEMHAAMPRIHGQPPLALATFRRRWPRAFPDTKHWKDLSF